MIIKMNKSKKRAYSQYCQDAVRLLGYLIQTTRKEKKMTTTELAERAGISRGTLYKIEQGNMTSELGIVFEVAMILGIQLFEMPPRQLQTEIDTLKNKLTLIPKRIRKTPESFDDNF